MAKVDEEAWVVLNELVDTLEPFDTVCLTRVSRGYECTVFSAGTHEHVHYEGETLVEAVMKARKATDP